MDAELLKRAQKAIDALYYKEPLPGREKLIEAVARVVIEACAEIASRDSILDWSGGSTGNAVGTRERIVEQIRALAGEAGK